MLHLNKITFPVAKELADSRRSLVIIPVGVVEEHGPHLPLGLDTFAAEVYAEEAARHLEEEGYTVVLAPAVSYGVARIAADFPGTLSLEPETLRALITDIGRSLAKNGYERQVILNGHGESSHTRALDEAAKTLVNEGTARVVCVGFTNDAARTQACCQEGIRHLSNSPRPDREAHAGEKETSVALYSFPEFVDRKVMATLEPNFDYDFAALRGEEKSYWSLSGGRGYFGAPAAARAETGRALVSVRGGNMARIILQEFGSPKKRIP